MKKLFFALILVFVCTPMALPQDTDPDDGKKSEEIIKAGINKLGGERYLNSTSVASKGKFSITQDRKIVSYQSFVDVIIYPDKERTDFSERGSKTVQANAGGKGWIYQELFEKFEDQTEKQMEDFQKSLQTHYDFLLRGKWKGEAELSYKGRRQASLGKRNDVLRLEFESGFWVEYEFDDDGFPAKTVYSGLNAAGGIVQEDNRYAQFILIDGIYFPFVVDHYTDGKRAYRINYVEVEFNKQYPESIFEKPENPKKIKKLKI